MMKSGARKPGRPRVDATAVNVRMPPADLAALDGWIARQPGRRPSRPDALRRLAAAAIDAPAPLRPGEALILARVTAAELLAAHPEPKPRISPEAIRILLERRRPG